jgi:hypothetical protein
MSDDDVVRDEAERLIAAALAAASVAARGMSRAAGPLTEAADRLFGAAAPTAEPAARPPHEQPAGHFSTGSAECCVCPVCRLIATVRDPSPELVAKVAFGASDLAVGLTGALRAVSGALRRPPGRRSEQSRPADRASRPPDGAAAWRTATREADRRGAAGPVRGGAAEPGPDDDPWRAATTATT